MATSLETVKKAIEFGSPAYIPCWYNKDDTDVAAVAFCWRFLNRTALSYDTEWGFTIRPNTEPGIGGYHVEMNPLAEWEAYPSYHFPDANPAKTDISAQYAKMLHDNPQVFKNKYVLGKMPAGPYLLAGMLRGEANFFADLLSEKEKVYNLFGRIVDYQIELFCHYASLGAHGIVIHDDWGSSHGLIMSPASWREIFLPHYLRAKAAANKAGLHFGIQVTGNVEEVIPDLIEKRAVDMLFYPEPRVIGIPRLAELAKGKLCIFTCVDWKSTGPLGSPDDARHEVRQLVEALWTPRGGLGFWLSTANTFKPENAQAQIEEYRRLRQYKG